MTAKNTKLDQLTSLRFFAAFMIVLHHSQGLFGIKPVGVAFDQGVSFFFVLSGFILTYVYPDLEGWRKTQLFWKARIARIWPAYFVGFLLNILLIGSVWDTKIGLSYILMVQAWIPFSKYYFSYNAVGWSVSTEFFFYAMFPLLIYKWEKTWLIKFIFSLVALIALMLLSNFWALPDYGNPGVDGEGFWLTKHALLYISPLARIFEFVLGMCIARMWRKTESRHSVLSATIYEIGVIIICALSMRYMALIAAQSNIPFLSPAFPQWLVHAGSMFAFGLLIYITAQGRGAISKFLAYPALVVLGEISFSLYIIHQTLLNFYVRHITELPHVPNAVAFGIFCTILLISSYLMWSWVEMPGRRLIVGSKNIHGTATMKQSLRGHLFSNRISLVAATGLIGIIVAIGQTMGRPDFISKTEADELTPASLKGDAGASFGDLFVLRGLDIKSQSDGLHVKLAWESKVDQKLKFTVAIHLIDNDGNILGQADVKQSKGEAGVDSGDIWLDTVVVPSDKIDAKVTGVAIAIYEDAAKPLLLIDRGSRDWGNHRLIARIEGK